MLLAGKSRAGCRDASQARSLAGPPARMLPPGGAEQGRDRVSDPVRAHMRGPAALLQPLPARLREPVEPLVPGLPANAVARAELNHRIQGHLVIVNEPFALLHG